MIYRALSCFIIAFACFYGLGLYPLFDNNEGMYASIARDMLSNHQFIIPHLNDMAYIEKPPMLYWLMAISMSLFGITTWAVHLVPALALFITAITTQRFLTRVTTNETVGFTAAILLVTSLPLLAMERMIMCDMVMTCFLSNALMQFFCWQKNGGKRNLLAFWALLALAVLSKGFVAIFLAGGAIYVFFAWQRAPFSQARKIFSPLGIVLFLVIAAPWHIAATLQEPGFAWFYFINEHVMRFLNKREPHDYYTGHFWYYLPRLLAYVLPWTFLLLLFFKKDSENSSHHPALRRLLWSWFGFSLLFFSISGGKANYYMMAGMPALAMLMALQIETIMAENARVLRSVASGCLLLVAGILLISQFFCVHGSGEFYNACQGTAWPATSGAFFYVVTGIVLCWRLPRRWIPQILGASIFFLLPLLISGVDLADGRVSQKDAADYINANYHGDVAIYHEYEEVSSLAFYIDRPLLIVDSTSDDLLYGKQQPANAHYFLSLADWAKRTPAIPMVVLQKKLDKTLLELHAAQVDLRNVCVEKQVSRVVIIKMCDGAKP